MSKLCEEEAIDCSGDGARSSMILLRCNGGSGGSQQTIHPLNLQKLRAIKSYVDQMQTIGTLPVGIGVILSEILTLWESWGIVVPQGTTTRVHMISELILGIGYGR